MNKIAIVGFGKMGILHAALLNTMPDTRVIAICEKKPLVCAFARKIMGNIVIISELSELRKFPLDAAFIATPPETHYPVIKTLFEEGITKNIFTEKPLSTSLCESEKICDLVKEESVVMAGYNRRFSVTFKKAREILEKDILGKITDFEAYAYSSYLARIKTKPNKLISEGVLKDLGCHAIDLAIWFFGGLDVLSFEQASKGNHAWNDSASLMVKNKEGVSGQVKASWCKQEYRLPEIGLIIHGNLGTLAVNDDKVELHVGTRYQTWYRHDLSDNVGFFLGKSDYYFEDEAFIRAVKHKMTIMPDFQAACKVDKIIEDALRLQTREEFK